MDYEHNFSGHDLGSLGDLLLDDIDDARLGDGAEIAQLIAFASDDLAHDTAHDLPGASLGQVADNVDLLGCSEGTNGFADLKNELLHQRSLIIGIVREFAIEVRL